MNLAISLRSEVVKTKRTAAFYFTLVGAAIIPFIFLLNSLNEGLPDEDKSSKDPINAIFGIASQMNAFAILPLYIVLICTLLPQIEHKNNTWKQVLTTPLSKGSVYLSKFLNIQVLIFLFLVANHLFMWLVIVAIHFIIPDLNLLHHSVDMKSVFITTFNSYLSILAICSIQFWLGLRYKNFIVPVALGVVLWLTGTVLVFEYHSSLAYYFPYCFQTFPVLSTYKTALNQTMTLSIGYAAFILFLGFIDFRRRRMIG